MTEKKGRRRFLLSILAVRKSRWFRRRFLGSTVLFSGDGEAFSTLKAAFFDDIHSGTGRGA